jgi:hypothetical protein
MVMALASMQVEGGDMASRSPRQPARGRRRPVTSGNLATLIQSGRLRVGTKLFHKTRGQSAGVTATVTDAGLRTKSDTYSTPSGAARAHTGKPVDGWNYWRLPGGEPLDSLRSDLRREI